MFDPKKLGEEADDMIAKLNQQPKEGEQPPAEDQEVVDEQAIAQPSAEDQQTVSDEQGVEPTTPDVSAQIEELKKHAEAADQRWRVLQGMIDKKDEEISTLRALLSQLSAGKPESATTAETSTSPSITPEDVRDFGTDLIEMVGRKATLTVSPMLDALRKEIAELKASLGTVAQTTAKSANERFEEALAARVPNWQAINADPGFAQWLQQPAPFSTGTKLDQLGIAYQALDAKVVADIFKAYNDEINPPQPEQQPAATSAAGKFVAPGKSKAPASKPETSKQGRIWTRDAIGKLYDDKMAGRLTQKEFDELERDLFRAQQENRIAA